jgi:hypothetical protein
MQTKLKNNSVMITKVDKGNAIVLPVQQYETKIQNFLDANNSYTSNTDPTNTFQNQIRKKTIARYSFRKTPIGIT